MTVLLSLERLFVPLITFLQYRVSQTLVLVSYCFLVLILSGRHFLFKFALKLLIHFLGLLTGGSVNQNLILTGQLSLGVEHCIAVKLNKMPNYIHAR